MTGGIQDVTQTRGARNPSRTEKPGDAEGTEVRAAGHPQNDVERDTGFATRRVLSAQREVHLRGRRNRAMPKASRSAQRSIPRNDVERDTGFEPATFSLGS